MTTKKLLLEIKPIPTDLLGISLKKIFRDRTNSKGLWGKLKKKIFKDEGEHCWICGKKYSVKDPLELNEFWEIRLHNTKKLGIQSLESLHHICRMCHLVVHFDIWTENPEFIQIREERMKITIDDMINHFCKINECNRSFFNRYYKKVENKISKFKKYKWKIDFGNQNIVIEFVCSFRGFPEIYNFLYEERIRDERLLKNYIHELREWYERYQKIKLQNKELLKKVKVLMK